VTGAGNGCDTEEDTQTETFGALRVADLTVAELQEHDAGACWDDGDGGRPFAGQGVEIPTLREVLEAFPSTRFVIEWKQHDQAAVDAGLAVIEEMSAFSRSCMLDFDDGNTARIAAALPEDGCLAMPSSGIRCAATEGLFPFSDGGCPAYDVLWMPATSSGLDLVTRRVVGNAHDRGIPVFFFTIDDEATMARIEDVGADGVVTDLPDLARAVYGTRGMQ
jgi:glycerophosphoryl diester phosphodiesterase